MDEWGLAVTLLQDNLKRQQSLRPELRNRVMIIFRFIFMAIAAYALGELCQMAFGTFKAWLCGWGLVCGIFSYIEFKD
jgi:hypothetical protein